MLREPKNRNKRGLRRRTNEPLEIRRIKNDNMESPSEKRTRDIGKMEKNEDKLMEKLDTLEGRWKVLKSIINTL